MFLRKFLNKFRGTPGTAPQSVRPLFILLFRGIDLGDKKEGIYLLRQI